MSKFSKPLTDIEGATIETLMQRKLLFDGTTNADARIVKFGIALCNWCADTDADEKTHDVYLKSLQINLDRIRFDAKRSAFSVQGAEQIKNEYSVLKEKIKEETIITKHQIAKQKRLNEEMQTAKNERVQYKHLLALVLSKPDRKAVEYKVEKLQQQVDEMQGKVIEVTKTNAIRKNQLRALIQTALDLSLILKESDPKVSSPVSEDLNQASNNSADFVENDSGYNLALQGQPILDNCVTIQSDEEIQEEYVLHIQEPKMLTDYSETLFVIEADPIQVESDDKLKKGKKKHDEKGNFNPVALFSCSESPIDCEESTANSNPRCSYILTD